MKFWKSLSILIEETLPDWRDQFLSYKDLKKQLKLIHPKDGENQPPRNKRPRLEAEGGDCGCSGDENEEARRVNQFVKLLEDEMEKFNAFFVEKEEEYVIKWKELQDGVAKAKDSNEELMKVGREIVDFHGEMVLLENYSALNYTGIFFCLVCCLSCADHCHAIGCDKRLTLLISCLASGQKVVFSDPDLLCTGLVKILKKYDKRSGALIRLPFIQMVLQQPFYTTDVLNKLVKECETVLDRLFSMNEPSSTKATEDNGTCDTSTSTENTEKPLTVPKELAEIETMESMYMKLTVSALRVLKEIRSESSTVSMFSLPPLQNSALEEDWKKVPVLEQAAK
ncbi:hypothetical protein JRO89_XS03G0256100 [Xanthoceras sorbifolium]|uniref:SPX domain-containing protein n=1 Tax=Xanthoceras sorbifolium TaxID=99658 RepID=A0ABQ8ICB8_9ROSI|nr:hypothetical protein JRO89_XS03G0256100 [Xanthoceras sorbifolium]